MLRHAVATVAYRAAKVVREAPPDFGNYRAAPMTRTAAQIVSHMAVLLEWSTRAADGDAVWRQSISNSWNIELSRFFTALKMFDERLKTQVPLVCSPERIFQGPIADVLTHIGQLATRRRMAGTGVRGESYFDAEITAGRVGMDQALPIHEFD